MERQKTFKDLTGMKFGEWEVLSYEGNSMWKCRCSCGNIRNVHRYSLISGKSTSCGHSKFEDKENKFGIKNGDKFGEWEVIDSTPVNFKVKCRCSCGKVKDVNLYTLKSGKSTGCGHTKNKDRLIDLTGRQFGELEVIRYKGNHIWECLCSCGRTVDKHKTHLLDGRATSCGMHSSNKQLDNLTGIRFGKLIVIKYAGKKRWVCKCDCGNYKIVMSQNLKNGSTKSCGCIQYKTTQADLLKAINDYTIKFGRKPSVQDLADQLDIGYKVINYHLDKHNIDKNSLFDTKFASQGERELYRFVCECLSNEDVQHNVHNIIPPMELDIWIPSRKIALEYNGTYWHSTQNKTKEYHKNKTIECAKRGIRLIHIFEYEWIDSDTQNKIKELIKNALKVEKPHVLYARKLDVRETTQEEAYNFLNNNHMQNGIYSKVNIGLYNLDELLGVMSFSRPRFNANYQWELTRLAFKSGYKIVGGASKLFKYFLNKYNPDTVITYCNISKFVGNTYVDLGFKVLKLTEPNYVWVNEHSTDVIKRYNSSRSKLLDLGIQINEDDSEDSILTRLGYYKVYDSGNIVFAWNK